MAIGLALVLFVSGVIETFVTQSGLPAWAGISLGTAAELLFLLHVYVLGRRAARAGEAGDLDAVERSAEVPTAAGCASGVPDLLVSSSPQKTVDTAKWGRYI